MKEFRIKYIQIFFLVIFGGFAFLLTHLDAKLVMGYMLFFTFGVIWFGWCNAQDETKKINRTKRIRKAIKNY